MNAVEQYRGDEEIGNGANDGTPLARGLEGAVRGGRGQFGIGDAFDYVVGEKLMNFAEAAEEHPEFAQALPQFVSELRRMFTSEEIEEHLARVESARLERAMDAMDVYDPEMDDLAASEAEARRFEFVRELLTAPALGTS